MFGYMGYTYRHGNQGDRALLVTPILTFPLREGRDSLEGSIPMPTPVSPARGKGLVG